MVALQLLVVLSPAYRRPPPGTHPSRFPHHTTTGAANLISMVFRIRHLKPLELARLPRENHAYPIRYPTRRDPPGRKAPTTQGQQKF